MKFECWDRAIFEMILLILQKFEQWMLFINSKVKVEINDAAISKILWLLAKIFWVYYM